MYNEDAADRAGSSPGGGVRSSPRVDGGRRPGSESGDAICSPLGGKGPDDGAEQSQGVAVGSPTVARDGSPDAGSPKAVTSSPLERRDKDVEAAVRLRLAPAGSAAGPAL